jgi:uncharacterized protein
MIPIFPNFKKLEISDKNTIEVFTRSFQPYNDFELMSLWTYNKENRNAFSTLHDNLIVKIQDFITGKFFYSFIGTSNVRDVIAKLIQKSKEENLGSKLYLIPEISIKSSPNLEKYFSIKEDLDSFEYILSVDELAELKGNKYHDKRNMVNRFKKLYPDSFAKPFDLTQEKTRKDIEDLFLLWEENKEKNRIETEMELTAIKRMFDLVNTLSVTGTGIYLQDKLIGFSIYHLVGNNFAILSFEKSDTTYKGINEYVNYCAAKHLKTLGATYINYEQDLGLPGLRRAKTLWRPAFFLKKYTIEEKT